MKNKLSIILIAALLIITTLPVNCKAAQLPSVDVDTGVGDFWNQVFTWYFEETVNHTINKKNITLDEYMADRGFITNKDNYTTAKNWVKTVIANNPNAFNGKTEDQVTPEDLRQWVKNNITVNNYGNGNVQFTTSGDFNENVNAIERDIISDATFFYGYAFKLNLSWNAFPDGDLYNAFRRFIVNVHETFNSDDYICILFNWSNQYDAYYLKKDSTVNMLINNIIGSYYTVSFIDNSGGNYMAPSEEYFGRYHYSGGTFVKEQLTYPYSVRDNFRDVVRFAQYPNSMGYTGHDQPCVYAFDTNQLFAIYKRGIDIINKQPVSANSYFITENYIDDDSSRTTTTNNIDNSVKYPEVINFIDDYKRTHDDKDPTDNDIYIYINNHFPDSNPTITPTPTPLPDNPSGGGSNNGSSVSDNNNGGYASASATANNSGVNVTVNNNHNINFNVPGLSSNGLGSGTVSGNGNGSSNIFDWISDIGSVIGDFIKNVGELIADVVKGITETITTILADIPNIISVLVEFVYGGLPDELKAIVTLGITTVIFVGVIKMMRK